MWVTGSAGRSLGLTLVIVLVGMLLAAPTVRAAGDPPAVQGAHGVRILRDGSELEVSGPFARDLPQQLRDALAAAPHAKLLHLDSPGGLVNIGLKISELIVAHQLDTYVDRVCASACTLAFLAGTNRWLEPPARLGFHRATAPDLGSDQANAAFRQIYVKARVPEDFIDHVLRTPATELWYPTVTELQVSQIITAIAHPGMFAVSGFGPTPDLATAERQLLTAPIYAALARTDADWPSLLRLWDHIVVDGRPITEFATTARTHLRLAARSRLSVAQGGALRDYAALVMRELSTIQLLDPEACWAFIGRGQINSSRYLSPELRAADLAASMRILTDSSPTTIAPPDPEERAAIMRRLVASLPSVGADPAQVLGGFRPNAAHRAVCPSLLAVLQAALALPAGDDTTALRAVFSATAQPDGASR